MTDYRTAGLTLGLSDWLSDWLPDCRTPGLAARPPHGPSQAAAALHTHCHCRRHRLAAPTPLPAAGAGGWDAPHRTDGLSDCRTECPPTQQTVTVCSPPPSRPWGQEARGLRAGRGRRR